MVKTDKGCFGGFKDLYYYMMDENICTCKLISFTTMDIEIKYNMVLTLENLLSIVTFGRI
jgi:hypothetical protein